jgi:HTH-type transcriptional regulator/antitoxin HigA
MRISPIKTAQDHLAAIARIERLIGAVPDSPEGHELDTLATLVDAYESKHHAIDAPSEAAALEFRMDQERLTGEDIEAFVGNGASVSEMLGKRS